MNESTKDQMIEQLQVEISGAKGLLNEIVSLTDLFMPILKQLPQTDKKVLLELEKRMDIVKMALAMDRQSAPHIVQSLM